MEGETTFDLHKENQMSPTSTHIKVPRFRPIWSHGLDLGLNL